MMKNYNGNNSYENIKIRIREGLKYMLNNTFIGTTVQLTYLLSFILFWDRYIVRNNYKFENDILNRIDLYATSIFMYALGILGYLFVIYLFSQPFLANKISKNLRRGGLVNHNDEAPLLISRKLEKKIGLTKIYRISLQCCGIPLSEFEKKKEIIQSSLNMVVDSIEKGQNENEITFLCVPKRYNYCGFWNESFFSTKNNIVILGESMNGLVEWDFSKIPHMIVGGGTGSGKSVLLQLILMQLLKHMHKVLILDLKEGIDYCENWVSYADVIINKAEMLKPLKEVVNELPMRALKLKSSKVHNIEEYNSLHEDEKLQHIFIACDEVSSLLNKKGLSKEDKELTQQIENYLTLIATKGRAVGIHLIFATQRPDAEVLSGALRNNMEYRICGSASSNLAQIVLEENHEYAYLVPKGKPGFFVNHDGSLFKTFLFDTNKIY